MCEGRHSASLASPLGHSYTLHSIPLGHPRSGSICNMATNEVSFPPVTLSSSFPEEHRKQTRDGKPAPYSSWNVSTSVSFSHSTISLLYSAHSPVLHTKDPYPAHAGNKCWQTDGGSGKRGCRHAANTKHDLRSRTSDLTFVSFITSDQLLIPSFWKSQRPACCGPKAALRRKRMPYAKTARYSLRQRKHAHNILK